MLNFAREDTVAIDAALLLLTLESPCLRGSVNWQVPPCVHELVVTSPLSEMVVL